MFRFRKKVDQSSQPPVIQPLEPRTLMSAMQPSDWLLSNASSSASVQGYTPAEIRKAYGFDQVSDDGAGQTIAIIDAYNDPKIQSDLSVFDTNFDLPAASLKVVNQSGGSTLPSQDAGWDGEIALDVEWAHAIAPAANILLVEANSSDTSNLMAAVNYARHATGVSVVSMSWGGSEFFNWGGGGESSAQSSFDADFTTPSGHQGVTFVAASGDSGSQSGVQWPASSPNVLSVGGTTLTLLDNSGTYGSETAWSGTSGGYSKVESEPTYQLLAQTTGKRSAPDVSYDADPNTGFAVYDSVPNEGYTGWQVIGGTSAGAPQWSALIAIADEGRAATNLGTLDGASQTLPLLYGLYSAPDTSGYSTYTLDFNDITTGGGTHFHGRFGQGGSSSSAAAGYDTVTGLGTPKAYTVISALAGSTSTNSGGTGDSGGTGNGSSNPALLPVSPLSGSTFTNSFPTTAVSGQAGSIILTLTNSSDTKFSGPLSITLYASSDTSVSSGDQTLTTITLSKITLRSGAAKTLKVKFDYPSDLPAGSYYIIASIEATALNVATAQAVSSTTVAVAAPSVDLAAIFAGGTAIKVNPGHGGTAAITITNFGNVTASGSLNLALYASADSILDASDALLKTVTDRKVTIRAGKSITLHVPFIAPDGLTGGTYDLIGSLTSFTQPADGNASNDIAVVGTVEA